MTESPSSLDISTKLERIAKLAKEIRNANLTTLAHHIDASWLREAYRRTRKDGAKGVDGQSAEQYSERLEDNLRDLLDRAKSGRYFAPPVRRVHIPKGDGTESRPIGIPTFEDKVLQRAVAMVIGEIYEQEFYDFSYGFRPGRSAHQALEAIQNTAWRMKGGWLVEVDIKKFFDTVDHVHLREAGVRELLGRERPGDDAHDLTALRDHLVGEDAHEPDPAAAVDDAEPAAAELCRHLARRRAVAVADADRRATEHAEALHRPAPRT